MICMPYVYPRWCIRKLFKTNQILKCDHGRRYGIRIQTGQISQGRLRHIFCAYVTSKINWVTLYYTTHTTLLYKHWSMFSLKTDMTVLHKFFPLS